MLCFLPGVVVIFQITIDTDYHGTAGGYDT